MKRILSIKKSAFLTLCYLQTINPVPQMVTAEKKEDIGISLKISVQNNVGKEISSATITTAAAGAINGDLTFDFESGPNSIHVYNDSCVTKNKQEIGRLAVTRKQAPQGSTIVVKGTTSQVQISLKTPDKAVAQDNTDEKASTPSTMPASLLEQIRAGKELAPVDSTVKLISAARPESTTIITQPTDKGAARRERRRKNRENKVTQENKVPVAPTAPEFKQEPQAPDAPPFIAEPTVPEAPDAPPFIRDTTPAPVKTVAPTAGDSHQALLEQIRAGKQPKTTPAQTKPAQPASSRNEFLDQIRAGTTLKKSPTNQDASTVTPSKPATASGGIISDEFMKKLQERREAVETEEEEDADTDEWD